MARIREFKDNAPEIIEIGGEKKAICKCGLTENYPFCNGSHRKTHDEEEGKLYKYKEDGTREEIN